MRRVLPAALVAGLLLVAAGSASAQTLSADFQGAWERQRSQIGDLAEAMPAESWSFKPTDPQQTFGERVLHVLEVNGFLLGMVGGSGGPSIEGVDASDKAAVMAALQAHFDYGAEVVGGLSDAQLGEAVNAAFLGQATRARVLAFSGEHTSDIYGQLVVYARLNGIVPPASRGGGM
jgi:uncharacterized damage-inducible protein DinB